MIRKRLIRAVGTSKKYIAGNVALQWVGLICNVATIFAICDMFTRLLAGTATTGGILLAAGTLLAALVLRMFCTTGAARMSYLSSREVKKVLRGQIFQKLFRLGSSYTQRVPSSEVVQITVEGVDQLETYFGAYLPQFFYSLLAPITLFIILSFLNFPATMVLLVCVPLIPLSIAAVQTFAKKLLAKYWGRYTQLGDTFLENLQGLTTLKIYQADAHKNDEMNAQAEEFRKITMKVLTMQLNSITIMDLVAYGGAAAGAIMAITQFSAGAVSLGGCLAIILLSADYFIPMRQLGSFFHIAMNGMAASDKIFHLLDLPEEESRTEKIEEADLAIEIKGLSFAYEADREVLQGADLYFPQGSFTAIVGESGCGKSTLASILMGRSRGYRGQVFVGKKELAGLSEKSLMEHITYVGHNSYLFKGTVRENLLMAAPQATDDMLWDALEKTRLAAFLQTEQGLDTPLLEQGLNLSGGQRQRLAMARALLSDTPIYIFDEATSNIDVESENHIMSLIYHIAKEKTVLLISHRLANVVKADTIYALQKGRVAEHGTHQELLARQGVYHALWTTQQALEHFCDEEVSA